MLSAYIAQRSPDTLRGKYVLELGSGTGLVGIVAAKLGADRVCITDQAPLLETMRSNVALNNVNNIDVAELNWGEPIPEHVGVPDIVLAADCVYFEPAFPLLVQTLTDLASPGSDQEILFCYKKRRKADKRFFTLLKKQFTWTEVDDNPDQPLYSQQAISLLRLQRRRGRDVDQS